jgi:23S rRNA (cytosine1962-C5)-methyltransferase
MATAVLTPKGTERAKSGHVWIYRSDVAEVSGAVGGDIVDVIGPRGRPVGAAFYSDRSQIALRLLTHGGQAASPALVRSRIVDAVRYRDTLGIDATAYRLVHAEGDLVPSLIVDRYGDTLVVQCLSQATDRLLPEVVDVLNETVGPAGILVRNDAKVRGLEGLESQVQVVYQRENREAAAHYAHGRLLDAFSYNGGFALALASRCRDLTALEISEDAAERIRTNAHRNGVNRLAVRVVNVFDELHELDRSDARFDTIVLDPPAFAKNKAAVPRAITGYKEINRRALRLLSPGGFLVTCSCSHHVDEVLFEDIVRHAAADAGVSVTVVEKRTQGRDHPVLLSVPETLYLKCLILRKL